MKKLLAFALTVAMLATMCVVGATAATAFDPAYSYDFETEAEGYNLITPYADGNKFRTIWTPSDILGTGCTVKADGDNQYGQFNGFTMIPYDNVINEPYVFGLDMMGTQPIGSWKGVFIRSSAVDFKSSAADGVLKWFGHDGSDQDVQSYTGTTGIFIYPSIVNNTNTLILGIKTLDHVDDTHWVKNLLYKAVPADVDMNGFVTYEFEDDHAGEIKINVGDKLFATIKYSNLGNYDTFTDKYYKTAKVYNAAGEEVGSTDAALICETSQIAMFTRNGTLNVDNIYFDEYVAPVTPPTPPTPPTAGEFVKADITPDGGHANNAESKVENGHLFLKSTGGDPYLELPAVASAGIVCADYPYMAIRLKNGNGNAGSVYFGTTDFAGPVYEGREVIAQFSYKATGDEATTVVNMSNSEFYKGTLNYFRYDFFTDHVENTELEVIGIAFFKTEAEANAWTGAAPVNPGTSDAAVVVIASVAAIALAGVVVCRRVKA